MSALTPSVEQDLELPTAQLRIRQYDFREPVESVVTLEAGRSYFNMCLDARTPGSCGSYQGAFGPKEYEPMGRVIFVPAGLPLHARIGVGRQWDFQCLFSAEACEHVNAAAWDRERLRESLHVRNASLIALSERIVAEMRTPGFASSIVIESLCSVVAIDLIRHFSAPRISGAAKGGLPGWRLRRIEERVRAEGPPPTLSELASLCGMSSRHLRRAFRQQTGRTLSDLVTEVRTSRAADLLASDALSLKEICHRLGFAHASAFSTAFRRATGESPSAYRARSQASRRPTHFSGKVKVEF